MATQARCATQTDGVEPGEMAHVTPPLAYSRTAHPIADRGTHRNRRAKEGWVVRKNSARDRRCKTVHLQPRTARVINRINATALKLRHELIKDIPVREMQTCMRVLNEVRARAERARGNGETGADTGK